MRHFLIRSLCRWYGSRPPEDASVSGLSCSDGTMAKMRTESGTRPDDRGEERVMKDSMLVQDSSESDDGFDLYLYC